MEDGKKNREPLQVSATHCNVPHITSINCTSKSVIIMGTAGNNCDVLPPVDRNHGLMQT